MSNYHVLQVGLAGQFAELSGLPFVYMFTGGGHDAIYGETSAYRVCITDESGSVPSPDVCHYVGVYSIDEDELLGEIFPSDRADLLATLSRFNIRSLDELVNFVLERGFSNDGVGV